MEEREPDPVHTGRGHRVLITGAGGQLGLALAAAFADEDVVALTRAEWDVRLPPPAGAAPGDLDLVLHAAAWTDVDGAEADPQEATAANVGGTANAAALGAPLVAFSTDYVFDGRKREPYVESDGPNPLSAYGRSKLLAEAIFEAAGSDCRVRRISTEELGRPARRPAYAVLRSERDAAPELPHWREGLAACLAELGMGPAGRGR